MAIQGFTYTLDWKRDFKPVDSAPAEFSHCSAQTKAAANLDPAMKAKKDPATKEFSIDPASVKVIVKSLPSESWVVIGKETDVLMAHEQLHYNISALGGRDLERKVKNLKSDTLDGLIAKKVELGAEIQALIDKVNKDYDDEIHGTNHGLKTAEQAKWALHITNLMGNTDGELKSP